MLYGGLFIAGLLLGALVAWLVAGRTSAAAEARAQALQQQEGTLRSELEGLRLKLEAEQQARASATASLEAERKNLQEQRALLQEAQAKLTDTFKALSSEVLGTQSESFLQLATQAFNTLLADSKGDLAAREQAIGALLQPLKDAVERYEQEIQHIETSRKEAYGSLRQHLAQLGDAHSQLQRETANLVTALRKPQVRGRWGEITLRRLAELAGMVDRCDFFEQPSIASEERLMRPDMVVHLPGEREVIVDSKVALDAYLDAVAADSEEKRQEHLVRHAAQVRRHMEQLGSKAYWDRLSKAPEFVVQIGRAHV